MVYFVPLWLAVVGWLLRRLWRLARVLAEVAMILLWAAGMLLFAAGRHAGHGGVRAYRAARRRRNPLYDQLREIRNLAEVRGRFRRVVHRLVHS